MARDSVRAVQEPTDCLANACVAPSRNRSARYPVGVPHTPQTAGDLVLPAPLLAGPVVATGLPLYADRVGHGRPRGPSIGSFI